MAQYPKPQDIDIRIAHLIAGIVWGIVAGAFLTASVSGVMDALGWFGAYRAEAIGRGAGFVLGWALAIFCGYRTGLAAERRTLADAPGAIRREWTVVLTSIAIGILTCLGLFLGVLWVARLF